MSRLPSFLIIGAMKSATSTIYEQLSRQPGIFLPELKEPNFFSDDRQYARGLDWYEGLFNAAQASDLLGEASTHYTKLPTYPQTIARMRDCLDHPRLIYVMRHPVDRMISQYVHQWSEGEIHCGLDEAVTRYPELTAYSCYARQLAPFIEAYGKAAILPVFFDRLKVSPQQELERICRFIGYSGTAQWETDLSRSNVSAERVRKFPFYNLLVDHPIAAGLRRGLVPKAVRTKVRQFFSMTDRPVLGETTRQNLENVFDKDLAILGGWLGIELDCSNFCAATSATSLNWR
jgi:Sulfotransferase domain